MFAVNCHIVRLIFIFWCFSKISVIFILYEAFFIDLLLKLNPDDLLIKQIATFFFYQRLN